MHAQHMQMRGVHFLLENRRWLGAGALLAFLSSFGQTFFISIFAGEIQSEFGLSNGQWGGIYTLGTAASAVVVVWAGGLADRFRVRALGAVVLSLLVISCLLMAISTVFILPFVIFALRFSGQGMTSHLSSVAMARWFVASRGRALSIAALGFSFGEALLPIIFVMLLAFFDWRSLWVVAALLAALGIPVLLGLLTQERTPQSLAKETQTFGMQGRHWTRRDAIWHPLFWIMVPAILGLSAFNTAFFFLQVHFAEVKGWQHIELVAMFPVYTITAIAAMMLSGWFLDKYGTARIIPFYQLPTIAAFVCFSVAHSPAMALLGMVFLGLTAGANSTLPSAFWAEFYGTMHIGAIKSLATAVMVLGSALGPGITGVMIDFGVGIETQYLGVAIYFTISTLILIIGISKFRRLLSVAA